MIKLMRTVAHQIKIDGKLVDSVKIDGQVAVQTRTVQNLMQELTDMGSGDLWDYVFETKACRKISFGISFKLVDINNLPTTGPNNPVDVLSVVMNKYCKMRVWYQKIGTSAPSLNFELKCGNNTDTMWQYYDNDLDIDFSMYYENGHFVCETLNSFYDNITQTNKLMKVTSEPLSEIFGKFYAIRYNALMGIKFNILNNFYVHNGNIIVDGLQGD